MKKQFTLTVKAISKPSYTRQAADVIVTRRSKDTFIVTAKASKHDEVAIAMSKAEFKRLVTEMTNLL